MADFDTAEVPSVKNALLVLTSFIFPVVYKKNSCVKSPSKNKKTEKEQRESSILIMVRLTCLFEVGENLRHLSYVQEEKESKRVYLT